MQSLLLKSCSWEESLQNLIERGAGPNTSPERITLLTRLPKAAQQKGKRFWAQKYRLTVEGETHRWTGRGRTPKVSKRNLMQHIAVDSVEIK